MLPHLWLTILKKYNTEGGKLVVVSTILLEIKVCF
jgi:hypothetical protein